MKSIVIFVEKSYCLSWWTATLTTTADLPVAGHSSLAQFDGIGDDVADTDLTVDLSLKSRKSSLKCSNEAWLVKPPYHLL